MSNFTLSFLVVPSISKIKDYNWEGAGQKRNCYEVGGALYLTKIKCPPNRENASLTSSTLKDVKLSNGNTGFRELLKSSTFLCTMTVFSSLPDLKSEPNFPSESRGCQR